MSEPVSGIAFDSMIDQVYPKAPFTEQKFMVRAVLPEHTFLERYSCFMRRSLSQRI